MMEGALACPVCSHMYESGERDPLVLPCGHTFCRSCLLSLEVSRSLACPSCRAMHRAEVADVFPVNYSLLNLTQVSRARICMRENSCTRHGEPLNYWCRECQQLLCGCCILKLHLKEGHDVVHTSDFIVEKKQDIKKRANRLSQVLSESKEGVVQSFKKCFIRTVDLCTESHSLLSKDEELQRISREAKTFNEVESILVSETRLQSLQQERGAGISSALSDSSLCQRPREYLDVPDECQSTQNLETLPRDEKPHNLEAKSSQAKAYPSIDSLESLDLSLKSCRKDKKQAIESPTKLIPSTLPWPLTCCAVSKDGRQAVVQREDGLVLVSALSHRLMEAHVTVQLELLEGLVPPAHPEVFLELSTGERYLGRVFIRLWGHLRRAQHFRALCLASLGPSYTGARFEYVGNKNQPGEFIVGGGYLDQDSKRSSRGLLPDLEWGGQYAGEEVEGILQGAGGGHREYDALFCICTRGDPTGKSQCPFGEVVAGMDVVRAAVLHDPINDIKISRSGVVFPDA